jgi:hypothetical protein
MNCEEFGRLLLEDQSALASVDAQRHLRECSECRVMNEFFVAPAVDPPVSVMANAESAARSALTPVRPLAAPTAAVAGTALLLAGVFIAGVWVNGHHGWLARTPWQRAATYTLAGAVAVISLSAAMRERTPGSRSSQVARIAAGVFAALLFVFPTLVYGFHPDTRFWSHGALCSCDGLIVGILAGLAVWFAMRRGYFVAPVSAGWYAGLAAGSLAFSVQETYCSAAEASHVTLWHGCVVALLALTGMFAGWIAARREAQMSFRRSAGRE